MSSSETRSPTEQIIHDIWLKLLPSPPPEIPLDESFFDLGGHSILATRLIFELRNSLAVGAPLGIVFDYPTIRTLAKQLDSMRDSDLGLAKGNDTPVEDTEYAEDEVRLLKTLKSSYDKPTPVEGPQTIFLTGATGFLGAFILKDLMLNRRAQVKKVICHVRAKTPEAAIARLRDSGEARGAWDESWATEGLVEAVVGDLESDKLGLGEQEWERIAKEADVIIHNGALVSGLTNDHREIALKREDWPLLLSLFCRYIGSTLTLNCELPTCWPLWLSLSSLQPLVRKSCHSSRPRLSSRRAITCAWQMRVSHKVVEVYQNQIRSTLARLDSRAVTASPNGYLSDSCWKLVVAAWLVALSDRRTSSEIPRRP